MFNAFDQGIKYLVRREHSSKELTQKLKAKSYTSQEIERALTKLQAQNYQNDERFSQMLIKTRINQGKGEILIKQELKQHNLSADLSYIDFFTLAQQVKQKKFGTNPPKNIKEKAKQQRFLQSRGFSFEQIKLCF